MDNAVWAISGDISEICFTALATGKNTIATETKNADELSADESSAIQ